MVEGITPKIELSTELDDNTAKYLLFAHGGYFALFGGMEQHLYLLEQFHSRTMGDKDLEPFRETNSTQLMRHVCDAGRYTLPEGEALFFGRSDHIEIVSRGMLRRIEADIEQYLAGQGHPVERMRIQ